MFLVLFLVMSLGMWCISVVMFCSCLFSSSGSVWMVVVMLCLGVFGLVSAMVWKVWVRLMRVSVCIGVS